MKCAIEMIEEAIRNKKQIEDMERQAELKRIASAKLNTDNLIKEIEKHFERQVERGVMPNYTEFFSNIDKDNFIYLLEEDGIVYANKTISLTANRLKPLILERIREFFEKHCFKVEVIEILYKSYGLGSLMGNKLIIKPDPDCLK